MGWVLNSKCFIMKAFYIIFLIVLTQSFFGCQKRLKSIDDYHPKLKVTVEIVLGGVKVTGQVIEEGVSPLETVGFCFSGNPEFLITENQSIASSFTGDSFSYTYPSFLFQEDSSYYFKAFGTTDYGYVESDEYKISNLELVSEDAPCQNTLQKYRYGTSLPNTIDQNTYISQSIDYVEYRNTIEGGPAVIGIQFKSPPSNGLFTSTESSSNIGPTEARIYIGYTGQTLSGGTIYVNHIEGNEYRIETCDLPFKVSSTLTSTLNAHWVIKI